MKVGLRVLGVLSAATITLAGCGSDSPGDAENTSPGNSGATATSPATTAEPSTTTAQRVIAEESFQRTDANGDPYEVRVAIVNVEHNVQNDGLCSQADFESGTTLIAVETTYSNPNSFELNIGANPPRAEAVTEPALSPLTGQTMNGVGGPPEPCQELGSIPVECEYCGVDFLHLVGDQTVRQIFMIAPPDLADIDSIKVVEGGGFTTPDLLGELPF